jgi:hypothetical protein
MRLCIVFLLCLGLFLPAWAGLLAAGTCCPSQADMVQQIVDAAETGEALPDCCNDLSTLLQTGQTCKTGQAAGVTFLGCPASAMPPAVDAVSRAATPLPTPGPPSAEPGGIWRPPL